MVTTIGATLGQLGNIRVILALTAVFGVLTAQAGRGTLAYFTSTATSGTNVFTAGTLHLNLTDADQTANLTDQLAGDVTTTFTATDFQPLQTKTAPLTVSLDTGNVPTYYGLKYTATSNALTPLMNLTIKTAVGATVATDCTAANYANGAMWAAYATVNPLTVTAGSTVIDSGASADAGAVKARRSLVAGTPHILCFQFAFADGGVPGSNTTGDNAAQGLASTVTLTFDGRQQAAAGEAS